MAGSCLGGGYAKDCQAQGGLKVDLAAHMKSLWQEINFTPTTFELPVEADQTDIEKETSGSKFEGDFVISEDPNFRRQIDRPEMKEEDIKKVIGLQVRNLPPTLSDEDVVQFLAEHVDKDITVDRVSFMKTEQSINAAVESGLEGAKVIAAAKVIEFRQSKKKFFDKPL